MFNFNLGYDAVSWVLLRWHQLFALLGLSANGGANWALSIVALVLTARLLLVGLFVKQLHYQRQMQEMQPKIAKLRARYAHDKAAQQRELLRLQQAEGFNPLAGCLPMVLQIPVFLALLHVVRHLAAAADPTYQARHPDRLTLYGFTKAQTLSAAQARIFGGAPLAGQLRDTAATMLTLGGELSTTRLVIAAVVLLSAAATFATQWLAGRRSAGPLVGPAATTQKAMRYLTPLGTLGSGLFFPLGVLLYWLASNLWTAGQQAWVCGVSGWRSAAPPEAVRPDS